MYALTLCSETRLLMSGVCIATVVSRVNAELTSALYMTGKGWNAAE